MRSWKILSLSLLLALCWTVTGWSEPAGMMPGHGGGFGVPYFGRLLHALQLTDAQKAQIRDIMTNSTNRQKLKALRPQTKATQQQLADLMLNPNIVDPAKLSDAIQNLAQQLKDQHAQMVDLRFALAQEIRLVLTPDQLTQATQITGQLRELKATRQQLLGQQP